MVMKNLVLALVVLIVIAGVAYGIWASYKSSTNMVTAHASATAPTQPVKPFTPHPSPNFLALNEWQELRSARDATLRDNPDLAAEYKTLLAEMDEQQKDLDAAMIKADPNAAPIVAKLVALRQHNSVPNGPAAGK